MSDNSSPPSQGAALPKKDDKRPITGSLRGSKRPSSNPQATSGGNLLLPQALKSSASPSNPAARLAAGEAISRPSSADSHARSGSKDSRPRHGPRNSQSTSGKKPQTPTSTSSRSNSGGAGAKSDNAPDNSSGLSALQRVITDLKSIAVPANQQGGIPATIPVQTPLSASTGSGSQSYNPVHFAAPAYSAQLGVMQEDAEDAYSHDSIDDVVYHDQPGFTQPAPAPPQRDRVATGQAPMGSFTAPRFQALAQQESGESIGPSGRPQLAPNFMFGGNRRKPSDDDGGFQFPQHIPTS
ncbi:uncharacterized protein EI90DRAFT_3118066 [Cantharellus anzutake]|uniref:uncharacterized protein n=1 Tax=Cantharellus anzutake TaxID=1750568 RepID=UPI001906A199|nr:uncharacterized protein EI90DRAFT_3118066 [Cantharellus anzutake]KAF8339003.1 hypothetical protein EI90DRAFT_3118066 [Cantharellus anzutake]